MVGDLDAGWDALATGRWEAALEHFQELDDEPAAWEGIGVASWWLDDADGTIAARERAHRLYLERGDEVGAARLASALAWDSVLFGGRTAVARGWLGRARRLLQGRDPVAEHAWLAIREAEVALHEGDAEAAAEAARRAAELADELGREDVRVAARSLVGLALVQQGSVEDGMRRLDEAAVAATAGDVDDLMWIGKVCCNLITACEHVGDIDRATQWCDEVKEFAGRWELRTLFNVCRTQYGAVLLQQGRWGDAERELQAAIDALEDGRRAALLEGTARLGELRRRQGRLDEARSLLAAAELHPVGKRGLVKLAIMNGDTTTAVTLARRLVRSLKESERLARLDAHALLAHAFAAAGDAGSARREAATALSLAAVVDTPFALGTARWAAGVAELAGLEVPAAVRLLEDAVDDFGRARAPYERAHTRLVLAEALRQSGATAGAAMEERAARAAFAKLGVAPRPTDDGPLTRRELQVVALVADGRSNREIAEALVVSEHTVHRHVANILRKLGEPTRAAVASRAARDGLL